MRDVLPGPTGCLCNPGKTSFTEYAYFSSYADTWLAHSRQYVSDMIVRFRLGEQHQVVEVASNDGYLLQYFKEAGIPGPRH